MDWNLVYTIVIQLISIGILGGIVWTRISNLEKDMDKFELRVEGFHQLREDFAVVKSELRIMNACLTKLSERLDRQV